ncbi:MAG: rhomboid family intramembrane serine protease [Cytophagales bacterium]|nr:rhomboid family intramembrane serine protease [Cytophagales bacterium]
MAMRISYNSPVVLSFTFLSTLLLIINQSSSGALTPFITVGGHMDWSSPLSYLRLFTHVLGHSGWEHLLSNFTFILLIGPILEEKHGSGKLLLMILVTALVTGLFNQLFESSLWGASGIVFMMILLSSVVNAKKGTIPLTFILIATLFLGKEIVNIFHEDQVAQSAHIVGGICGAVFGFMIVQKKSKKKTGEESVAFDSSEELDL